MAARSLAGEDLLGQIYGGLICFMVCVSTGWSLVGCRAVDTVIGLNGGRYIVLVNLASMVVLRVRFPPFGLRCSL